MVGYYYCLIMPLYVIVVYSRALNPTPRNCTLLSFSTPFRDLDFPPDNQQPPKAAEGSGLHLTMVSRVRPLAG